MCGIVGYVGYKKAEPILLSGLSRLEYRGYDSAGIAVIKDGEVLAVKSQGRVSKLYNLCESMELDSNIGIAHTRWATHGKPSTQNAHPHLDNSKTFAVVHNGIIENYMELKSTLQSKGYEFLSDTDTEVIPNLIHYYYSKSNMSSEMDFLSAVRNAVKQLNGSFAIEVLCKEFPNKMIVTRQDSPLVIGKGSDEMFIASDIPAILSYTNNFYLLNDLEIAYIAKDFVTFFDLDLDKLNKKPEIIDLDASSIEKNGYEDFMLKEIHEQPTSVRETIGTLLNDEKISFPNLELTEDYLKSLSHINIVACGTAMHAGLGVKPLLQRLLNIPVIVDIASEFRYNKPIVSPSTLCIFISQSGETADTIAALKLCKDKGAKTIAITNVIGSSITREADHSLYTHAGPEIAVASTKAYTSQLVCLTILSMYMSEVLGAPHEDLISDLKSELLTLPDKMEEVLENVSIVKDIADATFKEKDAFFLGRGIDYAIAMESSLKLKEITYIHSEAYPSGELKHGPIALIDKGIFVISILTNPDIAPKTLSNIKEVLSRGAKSIIVSSLEQDFREYADFLINIPKTCSFLSPIITIIPLQLLSYYISKNKGIDVDKPRNLAKSVTVE